MQRTLQRAMLLVAIFLTGCYPDTTNRGGSSLVEDSIGSVIENNDVSQESMSVIPFIDVSKGMSGYYAGREATRFKADVWSVLTALNSRWGTDSIMLLSEKNPRLVDIQSFRKDMNQGKLLYDNNTSIPQMIEAIVTRIEQEEGVVGVLVSDMKYSPTNSKAPQAEMAQYATDIEVIFNKSGRAVSLICAVSDYKTKNRKCDEAPYYYLIIGNPRQVSIARNEIVNKLKTAGTFVCEVERGVNYDERLQVSHVKAKGLMVLDKEKFLYGGYDRKVADTVAVSLRLDLSAYPHSLRNSDTLASYLSVETSGGARCFVSDIETKDSEAKFAINIYGIRTDVENITISISGYNPSLPRGIEQFYGAQSEAECDRTISIDQFVRGIADSRQLKSTATITITKKNKI